MVLLVVKRSFRRYTKFLLIGLSNAAVDLAVLNLLLFLYPRPSDVWLSVFNTIGVGCAIVNSYIWNRFWTFADVATGGRRERAKFFGQAILNILLNDVILVWAAQYLTISKSLPFIVSSNLAKALAMFVSSSMTYIILRLFVFQRTR